MPVDGSLTLIWTLAVAGLLMLAIVAFRMILAPENRQERTAARRLKNMRPQTGHGMAEAMVRRQRQGLTGLSIPLIGDPALLVRRAGLEGKEPLILTGLLVLALAIGVALSLRLNAAVAYPAGVVISILLVKAFLRKRHATRVDALTQQLPDALDLMMRGLRIGHPISATISNVGRTMPDPIGAEFRQLAEQVSHGDYLTDAFTDFADRVGQEDVEYLAVSIRIQHGTGGNLADMLGTLAKVVRDRIVMRRRVRAISSEGRMSAYVLSALPVLIYLVTSYTAPDYYGAISDDPMYQPIAITIILLVVANFLALRKLVTFKI
ncbi:hypothetical protein BOO69_00265 [Sulfitobacter alexandrii]|uniref:Type II secretion system protein GspF domain-containing protein n=1 Tax=Sulfitobacter alexandrii TaxID=1917485 RepID=A0A1J0WCH4_9RHOB|nr:type II secretion system F family protein [Sulfitobacter alexandrii]APE42015.1 hypothetical protein BOO69_00265 [Sulfitobacter alexandrii]